MKESDFKAKIASACRKKDVFHIVQMSPVIRGLPDILIVNRGETLALELKIDEGPATPIQLRELLKAANGGAYAAVVRLHTKNKDKYVSIDRVVSGPMEPVPPVRAYVVSMTLDTFLFELVERPDVLILQSR